MARTVSRKMRFAVREKMDGGGRGVVLSRSRKSQGKQRVGGTKTTLTGVGVSNTGTTTISSPLPQPCPKHKYAVLKLPSSQ
jgi:hypothetical protein